ncbi:MAG: hypothetical protein WDO73_37855 [Ignavibacteriota bacterium]
MKPGRRRRRRSDSSGGPSDAARTTTTPEYQDQVESAALYDQLEHEIVPAFYERGADLLPRRWIAGMKSSVATLCATFNMQRVVKEYTADCYLVAHERYRNLTCGNSERARALAAWSGRVGKEWPKVRVESVDGLPESHVAVGSFLQVRARVRLGAIQPGEVAVELYMGRIDARSEITGGVALPMRPLGDMRDGRPGLRGRRRAMPRERICMGIRCGYCRSIAMKQRVYCRAR